MRLSQMQPKPKLSSSLKKSTQTSPKLQQNQLNLLLSRPVIPPLDLKSKPTHRKANSDPNLRKLLQVQVPLSTTHRKNASIQTSEMFQPTEHTVSNPCLNNQTSEKLKPHRQFLSPKFTLINLFQRVKPKRKDTFNPVSVRAHKVTILTDRNQTQTQRFPNQSLTNNFGLSDWQPIRFPEIRTRRTKFFPSIETDDSKLDQWEIKTKSIQNFSFID